MARFLDQRMALFLWQRVERVVVLGCETLKDCLEFRGQPNDRDGRSRCHFPHVQIAEQSKASAAAEINRAHIDFEGLYLRWTQFLLQGVPAIHHCSCAQASLENNARKTVRADFNVSFTFVLREVWHAFSLRACGGEEAGL